MKAAVFHGPHQPLTIEDVDIDKPIGRTRCSCASSPAASATATCTSSTAIYPFPAPAILGHEAAGIVEAVGPQVDEFKPGDHVIACLSVFCGHCDYCLTGRTHLCSDAARAGAKDAPPKLLWNGTAGRTSSPTSPPTPRRCSSTRTRS